MSHRFFQRIVLVLGVLIWTGCTSGLEKLSGTYEGDFSIIENGSTRSYRVSTHISDDSSKSAERSSSGGNWTRNFLEVSIFDQVSQRELGLIRVERRGIGKHFLMSSLLPESHEIELENRGDVCAVGVAANEGEKAPILTFCAQGSTISLFSSDSTGRYRVLLYLSKRTLSEGAEKSENTLSVVEKKFSLPDLFSHMLQSGFETRVATEKLFQAQQQVKIVRSQLFPSVSYGGVMTLNSRYAVNNLETQLATSTVYGYQAPTEADFARSAAPMVGSLVPFIFPSYWMDLEKRSTLYEGEVMAYQALLGNQMNTVEDFYHDIIKDQRLLALLRETRASLLSRHEMISLRVEIGLADKSDLLGLNTMLGKNEYEIARMEEAIRSQYAILSRGLGLSPREKMVSLAEPAPLDLDQMRPVNELDLMAEAKSGSLELRQVEYLERAAHLQTRAEYFSFINPSEWIGLHMSIVHRIKIAKSAAREVGIMRESMIAEVESKVQSLAARYNLMLEHNRRLQRILENYESEVARIEMLYQDGRRSALDLYSAIGEMMGLRVEKINAEAELSVIQGKLNRLLWREVYADALQVEVPRTFW